MSVEKIEINEPVDGEIMTLEEQLAQQEAEQAQEETTQPEPSGQEEAVEQEQPTEEELILGKFKSQDDLVEAYENLEKRLSEKQETPEAKEESQQEEAPIDSNVSDVIKKASDSFYENGELSEENFKALEDSGIPREFVEAYVKGQEATLEAETAAITNTIGGQENYDAMTEWAANNLPESEVSSYNEIVESGSTEAAKMAVRGMYARYVNENGGSAVNIKKGNTSGAAIQPFNSNAQVVEAMNDRRYEMDPAYRAEVERRISVSNNI